MMGLKYHNALHEIITGKRKLPKSYIPHIVKTFSLSADEAEYLSLLTDIQRAKAEHEREFYLKRLREFSASRRIPKILLPSVVKLFSDHFFLIILALSKRKHFHRDPVSILREAGIKINFVDAEDIVMKLSREKIFSSVEESTVDPEVFRVEDGPESVKVFESAMRFAQEHFRWGHAPEGILDCVVFNTVPENMDVIKQEINSFLTELAFKYQVNQGEKLKLAHITIQGLHF